ncbi:MAG: CoA pyrophosphatase [Wenzhouxiangella sp.]|nr:MAG: CoA pyrophosphatase [Wenzhouxiangella sp.]
MADTSAGLLRLAAALFPLGSNPDQLPVVGYRPDDLQWSPASAAVLVPIQLGRTYQVILTVRSRGLPQHAGQVSLPGGGPRPGERGPVETALREASEEIGLRSDQVRPLGLLPCCDTITAFRIVPVVALIAESAVLKPDPAEVSEAFSMPLAQVLDLDSYRRHHVERSGQVFEAWSMRSGHRPVWGATAAILRELALLADQDGLSGA